MLVTWLFGSRGEGYLCHIWFHRMDRCTEPETKKKIDNNSSFWHLRITLAFHRALKDKWLDFLAQEGGVPPGILIHHNFQETIKIWIGFKTPQPTRGPRCSLNLRHVRCSIILIIFRITRRSAFVMSCNMIIRTICFSGFKIHGASRETGWLKNAWVAC